MTQIVITLDDEKARELALDADKLGVPVEDVARRGVHEYLDRKRAIRESGLGSSARMQSSIGGWPNDLFGCGRRPRPPRRSHPPIWWIVRVARPRWVRVCRRPAADGVRWCRPVSNAG